MGELERLHTHRSTMDEDEIEQIKAERDQLREQLAVVSGREGGEGEEGEEDTVTARG
jgi:hypothetical protein